MIEVSLDLYCMRCEDARGHTTVDLRVVALAAAVEFRKFAWISDAVSGKKRKDVYRIYIALFIGRVHR